MPRPRRFESFPLRLLLGPTLGSACPSSYFQSVPYMLSLAGLALSPTQRMFYADRTMTSPGPNTDRTEQERYTVHEAALLLGLSVEAVRKRAERGRLASVKGEDGARYILLDADRIKSGQGPDGDRTELVESLQHQIDFLREELAARNVELRRREEVYREESRRKDHLLAAALERMPQIEAPWEPSESPLSLSKGTGSTEHPRKRSSAPGGVGSSGCS